MASEKCHLFVLVHGLWGGPNHMVTIENCIDSLVQESDTKIAVLRSSSFRFWKTYDGLELCARRLMQEIFYEIETLKQKNGYVVDEISIVGYSLGGLFTRYLIGLLYEMGFFETVKPVFFSTFATPHLGIEFFNKGLFGFLANRLGKFLFGLSGRQLFLGDSEKALVQMADPESKFYKGLQLFEKRLLLANIKYDRTVAFYTSYITDYAPFEKFDSVKVKYLKELPQTHIGSVAVRPKFVDLSRSLASPTESFENPQEATSTLRTNKLYRYTITVLATLLFFPIWVPTVFTVSLSVSVYTFIKVRLIRPPKNLQHWERLKASVYGTEPVDSVDYQIGTEQREQRRLLRKQASFKGETSEFAENTMEGMLYAGDQLAGRSPHLEADTSGDVSSELDLESSKKATGALEGPLAFNVDDNLKSVHQHLEFLESSDPAKFPLFTPERRLPFGKDKKFIVDNLNALGWVKIPVFIEAWNSHDGIVARRGPQTNPKGTATIGLWASILRDHLAQRSSEK